MLSSRKEGFDVEALSGGLGNAGGKALSIVTESVGRLLFWNALLYSRITHIRALYLQHTHQRADATLFRRGLNDDRRTAKRARASTREQPSEALSLARAFIDRPRYFAFPNCIQIWKSSVHEVFNL